MVRTLPASFRVAPGPPALVFVMVKWCGHCTALKPRVKEFERIFNGGVQVYTVDGDGDPDKVREFQVEGFPTILYKTSDGKLYRYTGPRDPKALYKFVGTVDPQVLR